MFPEGSHASRTQANVNMFDDQRGASRASTASSARTGASRAITGIQTEEFLLAFRRRLGDPRRRTATRASDSRAASTRRRSSATRCYEAERRERRRAHRAQRPGFNIKTADGTYGWASYYGLWLPQAAMDDLLQTGDVVTHAEFRLARRDRSTACSSRPGHLIRNAREQLALRGRRRPGASSGWSSPTWVRLRLRPATAIRPAAAALRAPDPLARRLPLRHERVDEGR